MTIETSKRAALAAVILAFCLRADAASAQGGPTAPQRAPDNVAAPGTTAGEPDSGLVGAARASAPARSGPLGEAVPAPAAAPVESDTGTVAAAGAPGESVAGPRDETGADHPGEAAMDAAPRPLGEAIPLGQPVTPVRRSFLPATRPSERRDPVPVLGAAWGLTGERFRDEQLTHRRVAAAQFDTKFDLKALFAERGLTYPPRDLYFRLFKQEQVLEVWVRDAPDADTYTLLREYPICAIPGRLGPKTRIDDFQAPEGFYYIQGFNPESEYHLSLRLNYPNPADRIIGVADAWGGDIYIHGGCATVGCFPMTDEAMAQLYWLAVEARAAGQAVIPVHVFPARMDDRNMRWLRTTFERDERLLAFWENLREGYAWFEASRQLPHITVDRAGRYLFAATPPAPVSPAAGLVADDGPLGVEMPPPTMPADAGAPEAQAPQAEPILPTDPTR